MAFLGKTRGNGIAQGVHLNPNVNGAIGRVEDARNDLFGAPLYFLNFFFFVFPLDIFKPLVKKIGIIDHYAPHASLFSLRIIFVLEEKNA